ncbi:MAG TPA: YfhO family protein [Longimicrobiales bacterium]|nr:YfhO family protein [Longimicrobiales bacterium]
MAKKPDRDKDKKPDPAKPDRKIRRGSTTAVVEKTLNDIPRWVPPLVFALITFILFRKFIFGAKILGTDTLALSYFARHFYTTFIQAFHRFPLWDPLLYGGLPFVDGMHGDIFYPPSLALSLFGAERMWGYKLALHIFLAGIFMYLWLREIGVSRGSAMLGGIVFMMGADLVSLVFPGGDGKLFVSALAPLAFMFTERAARNRRVQDYATFSLVLALVMFTSHMQAAYFLVWGVTAYFIFRIVQEKAYPHIAAFALAGVLGVGAAAIQFIPPLGYLREWSHRASQTEQAKTPEAAYQYSTSYSLHPEEIMSLVVPEFVGDNAPTESKSGATYWGRNPLKLNSEYAGLLGLVLLPLLFLRRPKRRGLYLFFVALGVGALLYGLGADTPLFRLFYLIPGVKLFRAPSIIIFLYGMSVATLGALAFDRFAEERDVGNRAIWVVPGILLVLTLAAASGVLTNIWQSVIYQRIAPEKIATLQSNLPNIKTGAFLAFAIAVAIAIAIAGVKWKIWSVRTALIALYVIAFLEEYRVGAPFVRGTALMNEGSDPAFFEADEAIAFLKQRQSAGEVFRAFDISEIAQMQNPGYQYQNTLAQHGIEQLGGHHGNEIGRYREIIGGPSPSNITGDNFNVFNVTNTQYIIAPGLIDLPGFTEAFRGTRNVVYRKTDVLPRAYLAGSVEVVADDKAAARLIAKDFDHHKNVILSAPLSAQIQADPHGTVQWVKREPDRQVLKVKTDRPALLVVLDNYYSQWRAKVDGKETPIVRANYAFRAVPLAAGEHEVAFDYVAKNLKSSAIISIIIILGLTGLAFGPRLAAWTKR